MKIRCDKEIFVRRLAAVSRAVVSRPNLDVLNGLQLVAKDGTLTLTGSSLDTTIRARFEVSVDEEGEAVLPARLITRIVGSLNAAEVTIEVADDDAVISGGRSTFKVRAYASADFPRVSEPEGSDVMVSASALAHGIRRVSGAAGDDMARPILTGVLFEEHDGGLRMVATDSYRLALCNLQGVGVLEKEQKVIVPAEALDELGRLIGDYDIEESDEKVVVRLAERDIGFEVPDGTGTIQINTRLIEGDFPKYESLIPAESPSVLEANKGELTDALRRVKLIAREMTTPVRLTQSSSGVALLVKVQDVGEAEENVDASYEGEPLTIAFNPEYLLTGLEAIDSDMVKLDSTDELKPAVLRPTGSDDFLYLMMPVRIT